MWRAMQKAGSSANVAETDLLSRKKLILGRSTERGSVLVEKYSFLVKKSNDDMFKMMIKMHV